MVTVQTVEPTEMGKGLKIIPGANVIIRTRQDRELGQDVVHVAHDLRVARCAIEMMTTGASSPRP